MNDAILNVISQPSQKGKLTKKVFPSRIFVPSHILAKGVAEFFSDLLSRDTLPDGCFGITEDGKKMFRGDVLFELKATHGFPLDFALDRIINQKLMAVDWVDFIEAARRNKWWDFQIYETVDHALIDAMIEKETRSSILSRLKSYVVCVPHPLMAKMEKAK